MFYLAKYENSSNLKPMVNEADSVEQVLEWYICAGVEETCGDVPFAMAPAEKAIVPKPAASVLSALVKSLPSRRRYVRLRPGLHRRR